MQIQYDPNSNLKPQLRKLVQQTKDMYISGIHLGKAYSVPVNVCKLTNFTFDILRQCGEYIIRGRKEVEKEGK